MTKRYKNFPGGWWGFFTLILAFAIPAMFLYFDSVGSGGSANPVTFGFVMVGTVAGLVGLSGIKGKAKGFGLLTDPLTAVGLICTGVGLGFLIYTGLSSFSTLLSVALPNLSQAVVNFLYNPFTTQTIGGTVFSGLATQNASSSFFFIFVYMALLIAPIETFLRVGSWKAGSNWLGSLTNLSDEAVAGIVFVVMTVLWGFLHFASKGAGLVEFLPMAILFGSVIFVIPFMIFEHVIAPGGAFDLDSYISWGELSFHSCWNVLVSLGTIGITLSLPIRLVAGVGFFMIGIGIMIYKTFG